MNKLLEVPGSQGTSLEANLVVPFIAQSSMAVSDTITDIRPTSKEAEKNKLPQMPHNFIIAIDHIYEDVINFQTVIIQKNSYNNAKWSIITS